MADEELAVDQENSSDDTAVELTDEEKAMAELKEAIGVAKEDIGPLRMKLTITVPRDTLDGRLGEQFDELKRDAIVPGFRKGHAPLRLVEKRFGSEVGDQIKSQLIGSAYLAAVEKEDLKPLGDPLIWAKVSEERVDDNEATRMVETDKLISITQAIEELELPNEGDFTYSCELELRPEFELPELKKIPLEKPKVSVAKADVDKEIERILMSRGTFTPVEKGSVKIDDMMYVDIKMSVDGEVIASEDNFDMAARNMYVKGVYLDGFGDAVKGKKVGAEVTFDAEVPDDHENIDARGKTATFKIKINEIKRLEIPAIDEEFLSSSGFESEKEFRDQVNTMLESNLVQTQQRAMRDQVGQYLLDETKMELPEGLSQKQTERTLARRMIEMLQAGVPQAEVEKSMDEMRAKAHDQVIRDLKLSFVMEKIAEDHAITVPEERVNGAIHQIAARSNKRFDRVRDELSKGDGLTMLYLRLRDEQILDDLVADAEVSEVESPKKKKPATKKTAKKKAKKTTKKKTS